MESLSQTIQIIYDSFKESMGTLRAYLKESKKLLETSHTEKTKFAQKLNRIHQGEEVQPEPDETVKIELDDEEMSTLVEVMNWQVQLSDRYPNMLLEMGFIYLVALFDAYLLDVFCAVLTNRPETLKSSKKQLSYDRIIDLQASNALIPYLAQREMNEVGYKSIAEQAEYYESRFNIKIADSGVALDDLAEIRATRNLLVHNNGIVNSIYLDAVRNPKYSLGERVTTDLGYWNNCYKKQMQVAKFIRGTILNKFQ
jgi:hypothetical protein